MITCANVSIRDSYELKFEPQIFFKWRFHEGAQENSIYIYIYILHVNVHIYILLLEYSAFFNMYNNGIFSILPARNI